MSPNENWLQRASEMMKLAWPLIVASSFWSLQISIDRFFLGHYDLSALAALTGAIGVFWAPMALLHQTVSYIATFVAQYTGAGQRQKVGSAIWQAFYISLIGGFAFLLFIPLSGTIFQSFGHSANMQRLETIYFDLICLSALPTALVALTSGFFTGIENTRMVMKINAVGLVANFIFDYLFIFGNFGFPELGLRGAALGTIVANFCGAVYGFWKMFRIQTHSSYRLRSDFHLNFNMFRQFLKFGIPNGLQWALEGIAFTVFLIFVGRMPSGEVALASSGVTITLLMLGILPALGMGQAVLVEVGQNIGKKNIGQAEKKIKIGVQLTAIYGLTVGLLLAVAPGFFAKMFAPSDNLEMWSLVYTQLQVLIPILAAYLFFDCLQLVYVFAIKGAGDTRFPSLVSLLAPWPLFIFPTWWFSKSSFGIYWAWGAIVVYVIFLAVIFYLRYRLGPWRKMSVIESRES